MKSGFYWVKPQAKDDWEPAQYQAEFSRWLYLGEYDGETEPFQVGAPIIRTTKTPPAPDDHPWLAHWFPMVLCRHCDTTIAELHPNITERTHQEPGGPVSRFIFYAVHETCPVCRGTGEPHG